MGRLTRRIGNKVIDVTNEYFELTHEELVHELFNRLAYYEDLEENGLLIKLPCKVGDIVYLLSNPINVTNIEEDYDEDKVEVYECLFSSFSKYYDGNIQIRLTHNGKFVGWYLTPEHFGNVIFLTREEAKLKLKEMNK